MDSVRIPIWVIQLMVPLLWLALIGLIIYIWKKMDKRVENLETKGESDLKKQAETGAPLTLPEHDKICKGNLEVVSKEWNDMLKLQESKVNDKIDSLQDKVCMKIDSLEKNIILLIENKILIATENKILTSKTDKPRRKNRKG
jgi:hypothetical protein